MRRWETGPPLSEPAGFGHLEVSHVQVVDGQPVLVFSCPAHETSPPRRPPTRAGVGTWTVIGDSLTGPWDVSRARPFAEPSLYAARLVRERDGGWALLGFRDTPGVPFAGEIVDPIPVRPEDGELRRRRGRETIPSK